jgi:hypothetical protein
VVKVVFDLDVAALLAPARCDGCWDAHLMAQRAEECWAADSQIRVCKKLSRRF